MGYEIPKVYTLQNCLFNSEMKVQHRSTRLAAGGSLGNIFVFLSRSRVPINEANDQSSNSKALETNTGSHLTLKNSNLKQWKFFIVLWSVDFWSFV